MQKNNALVRPEHHKSSHLEEGPQATIEDSDDD